jgi:ADP-ribose pyrophosphatase YjhB (NUDIX family)
MIKFATMSEHLSPLTAVEIERLRVKQPARGYPPPEDRLIIERQELNRMVAAGRIVIPDDPRYHITDYRRGRTPEEGAVVDAIVTAENPMGEEQVRRWHELGLRTDTAGRPLHPRALELLPTVGMFTGLGRFYWYGPQAIGNLILPRERNGIVEYATVLVKRGELIWGFPGGFAKRGESPQTAAFREGFEEIGVDLQTEASRKALGGFVLTERLARIKCTPNDTAHAWMEEHFTYTRSIDDSALEDVLLDSSSDPHVVETRWMDSQTIYATENFLSPHRRIVKMLEGVSA